MAKDSERLRERDGGYVFPVSYVERRNGKDYDHTHFGMSLRDKFALEALRNGCGVDLYDMLNKGETDDIGILMYRVAESCMKAREK